MKVTLINYTNNATDLLKFTKETRLGLNSDRLFVDAATVGDIKYIANTIPSSWEFVDYTFLIEGVSRAFTHQFVRNRHGSYAQESLRVNDKFDIPFVWPDRIAKNSEAKKDVEMLLLMIEDCYSDLIRKHKIPTEDARSILPTNTATNIVAKFNLRTLVDLVKSRLGGRTQQEYQRVARAMVDEVTKIHPWTEMFFFGDEGRDYFKEIEDFAEREYGGDLLKKGELLKIVDKMRKQ